MLFLVKNVLMEYAYVGMEILVRLTLYNRMVMIGDITFRAMFGVMPQLALVGVTTRNYTNRPHVRMKINFVREKDASVQNPEKNT